MGLETYREKRDFRKTPEPKGKRRPGIPQRIFVVQRHAARQLHYDFRLELEGVLKSWAVPKGPSLDPAVKTLAMEVEDHPLQYGDFEGVIPEKQYGAGTVMLFDRGTWNALEDPHEGFRAGKLKFRLNGRRLRGDWILVRSGRQPTRGQIRWLLIKLDDDHARPDEGRTWIDAFDTSVETGRTMEQIAADADRVGGRERIVAVETSESSESEKEPERGSAPQTFSAADLAGSRRGRPGFLEPQLPTLVERPPSGNIWIHELKLDGYRLIAIKAEDEVRLFTRRGNDWTDRFPTIAEAVARLPGARLVLDGEIVVFAPDGTTDFQALQNSLKKGRFKDHVYVVFDILHHEGYDLTQSALLARKDLLFDVLEAGTNRGGSLRYGDHIRGKGRAMYAHACRLGVEGVVSKRADAHYVSGRSRSWRKSKCRRRQEFVIIGFTKPRGSRAFFGALLLACHDTRGKMIYCGRVGTGFTSESLAELAERLDPLVTERRPLRTMPPGLHARDVTWVRPRLVAEVAFAGWTDDGLVRQASFQGLREDKDTREVGRERPAKKKRKVSSRRGRGVAALAGVHLTHPDRILYPEWDVTKLDLARYYVEVADRILPHVVDRPLSLVRCPEGLAGECFFQKRLTEGIGRPVRTIRVEEHGETKTYLGIDDRPGLLTLVQLGVLEIHPWGSRRDRPDRPDRLVLDLDPGPDVDWRSVVEAAHLMRAVLQRVDLQSFVRTTGGGGLHVVVPLARHSDWSEVRQFAESLARRLARRWPEDFTASSARWKREGKIYVDYLRNRRGATAVASYSTRARPGCPVATPLSWEELTPTLDRTQFDLHGVLARLLALQQDPWSGFFESHQRLTPRRLAAVAK